MEQFVLGGKGLGQDEKKERVQQVHNQSSVRGMCVTDHRKYEKGVNYGKSAKKRAARWRGTFFSLLYLKVVRSAYGVVLG